MTLDDIKESEESSNSAFKQWMNSRQFHTLQASLKEDLTLYVAGLLNEIGDLKADVLRLQSKYDRLKEAPPYPEATFDELVKLIMKAATKEDYKVIINFKRAAQKGEE